MFDFVQGKRERQLQMKKERADECEQRKKVIDIEEEKLASDRRRELIEKAKQQQYYETDRIKTFHIRFSCRHVTCNRLIDRGMFSSCVNQGWPSAQ
jgi:hypothetical protein